MFRLIKNRKKVSILFVAVIFFSFWGGTTVNAAGDSHSQRAEDAWFLLNLFGVSANKDEVISLENNKVVLPDYLIPLNLRAAISAKTIDAESGLYAKRGSEDTPGNKKGVDGRENVRVNYNLVFAVALTLLYLLGSWAVHYFHKKKHNLCANRKHGHHA